MFSTPLNTWLLGRGVVIDDGPAVGWLIIKYIIKCMEVSPGVKYVINYLNSLDKKSLK